MMNLDNIIEKVTANIIHDILAVRLVSQDELRTKIKVFLVMAIEAEYATHRKPLINQRERLITQIRLNGGNETLKRQLTDINTQIKNLNILESEAKTIKDKISYFKIIQELIRERHGETELKTIRELASKKQKKTLCEVKK